MSSESSDCAGNQGKAGCSILTFDVEDWFHVENLAPYISRDGWDKCEIRFIRSTETILKLLSQAGVKATFFVLGWCAERVPELVCRIASDGHEIGTHGYSHKLVYTQSPDEFENDLAKSLEAIRKAAPVDVVSYRAPAFSIVKDTLWALDILGKYGIQCDSSVFPIAHHRYGIPDASTKPHVLETRYGPIAEFPIYTVRLGGRNIPAGGGGYFRLMPYLFIRKALRMSSSSSPAVLYMHPWEFDPGQPRLPVPCRLRFRCYYGLEHMERKLQRILDEFRVVSMSQALADILT